MNDPQDPLPESNWLWRRLLAFGLVIFIAWQLHLSGNRIARQSNPTDALVDLAHWLIAAWLITVLLYMVAPSAEQVAKMLSTLSAWKSGISTALAVRAAPAPTSAPYDGPDLPPPAPGTPEEPKWP